MSTSSQLLSRRAFGRIAAGGRGGCRGGRAERLFGRGRQALGRRPVAELLPGQTDRLQQVVGDAVGGVQSVRPVARDADAEFAEFLVRDNRHKES
ncbi:hypothetical protein ACWEIM_28790 [Streptomyces sp. NPDC004778]